MSATAVLAALSKYPQVQLAYLFGSVARGQAGHGSDVDVAIRAGRPLDVAEKMSMMGDIAAATGRPVDLIDLCRVGEPVLGQVLKYGTRLIGSNADHAELMRRHLFDAADFLPYVERMLEARRTAWIG